MGGSRRGRGGIPSVHDKLPAIRKTVVTSPYLALCFRVILGLVFVYASMSKIPYPAQFAEAVAAYRLIPFQILQFRGSLLPWIEFFCGLFSSSAFEPPPPPLLDETHARHVHHHDRYQHVLKAPITCSCLTRWGGPGMEKVLEDVILLLFAVHVYYFDRIGVFRRKGTRSSRSPGARAFQHTVVTGRCPYLRSTTETPLVLILLVLFFWLRPAITGTDTPGLCVSGSPDLETPENVVLELKLNGEGL